MNQDLYPSDHTIENFKGKFYFIIWYDRENNLRKGNIDD